MDSSNNWQWKGISDKEKSCVYFETGGICEKIPKNPSPALDVDQWSQQSTTPSDSNLEVSACGDLSHSDNCILNSISGTQTPQMATACADYSQFCSQMNTENRPQGTFSFYDMGSPVSNVDNDDTYYLREVSASSGYSSCSSSTPLKVQDNINKKLPYQKIGTYIIEKTIGKGNFSVVKLATHTITQMKVAIKIIDKTRLNEENLQRMYREVQIMKQVHHPTIVNMYQVMETPKMLYIVMEYVPNGEVFEYIANQGRFSEVEARRKFAQIVSAVEHCHAHGVVHRDLKAENLLLDHAMNVKLADFGFGTFYMEGDVLSTWCGSPPYAAPEIFKGEKYIGPKADIWSLGVVLYVLVCGALPFDEQTLPRLRDQVLAGWFRIPYWLSDACEELIRSMLTRAPAKRPSIAKIKAHKWMQQGQGHVTSSGELDEKLTPAGDQMKVGEYNELVIQIMERNGMSRKQVMESLERCAYDHLTATYLLLSERLKQQQQGVPFGNTAYEQVMRRPSSVAEQAMLKQGPRGCHVEHRLSLQSNSGRRQQPFHSSQAQPPQQQQQQASIYFNCPQPPPVSPTQQQAVPCANTADSLQYYLQNMHIKEYPGTEDCSRRLSNQSALSYGSGVYERGGILGTSIDEGVEFDFSGSEDGSAPASRRHTLADESGAASSARMTPRVSYTGREESFDSATSMLSETSGCYPPAHQFGQHQAYPPPSARQQRHSLAGMQMSGVSTSPYPAGCSVGGTTSAAYFLAHSTGQHPRAGLHTSAPLYPADQQSGGMYQAVSASSGLDHTVSLPCGPNFSYQTRETSSPGAVMPTGPTSQEPTSGPLLCPPPQIREGRRASDGGGAGPLQDSTFTRSLRQTGRAGGVLELCQSPGADGGPAHPVSMTQQAFQTASVVLPPGYPHARAGALRPASQHYQILQSAPQQPYFTATKRLSLPSSPSPFLQSTTSPQGQVQVYLSSTPTQSLKQQTCEMAEAQSKLWPASRSIRGRGLHQRQHGVYRPLPTIPSNEKMEERACAGLPAFPGLTQLSPPLLSNDMNPTPDPRL